MTDEATDHRSGTGKAGSSPPEREGQLVDRSLVLVVGRSQVNRVVVSRIVERSGLRPVSETPDEAVLTLRGTFPGTVILDGGADNRDCDTLMARLGVMRRQTEPCAPAVILLSTHKIGEIELAGLDCVDAVVSKPILPELLQPVVDRLIGRTQG